MQDHEHHTRTRKSQYRYQFTTRHHGAGSSNIACWAVSENEEFSVFDDADDRDCKCPDSGYMYGVLGDGDGGLRPLGTWDQQMAEFPPAPKNEAWHGYPLWPLNELGPSNMRGHDRRPSAVVFRALVTAGMLTPTQAKRLKKGDFV